jgi:hypothetical protein
MSMPGYCFLNSSMGRFWRFGGFLGTYLPGNFVVFLIFMVFLVRSSPASLTKAKVLATARAIGYSLRLRNGEVSDTENGRDKDRDKY